MNRVKNEEFEMYQNPSVKGDEYVQSLLGFYVNAIGTEQPSQYGSIPREIDARANTPLLFQPWTPQPLAPIANSDKAEALGILNARSMLSCAASPMDNHMLDFLEFQDHSQSNAVTLSPKTIMYDIPESISPELPVDQRLSFSYSHDAAPFLYRSISPSWDNDIPVDGEECFHNNRELVTAIHAPPSPPSSEHSQPREERTPAAPSEEPCGELTSQPIPNINADIDSEEPYSKLIWKAMMSAPRYKMTLPEIYDWFRENYSHKIKENKKKGWKGWQNSIRHNLSMNDAFVNMEGERISTRGNTQRANKFWALTEDAIANGVQSTTRFRGEKSKVSVPKKQRLYSKGGQVSRRQAQGFERRPTRVIKPRQTLAPACPSSSKTTFA